MTRAPERRLAALLVAGGRGERFGAAAPKQFLELGGRPLFEHAAMVLHAAPEVEALYVVVTAGWEERLRERLAVCGLDTKLRSIVPGGATRQESVWNGLAAIADCTHVLVHDAARPFLTLRLVRAAAAAAFEHGAATVAQPITDTLMRAAAADGQLGAAAIVTRDGVWSVQTPQAFELELLREAHRWARGRAGAATDDGGLILDLGRRLDLVPGNWWNIKVTRPADLARAETILSVRERLLAEEDA